jgi:hypothetical protein
MRGRVPGVLQLVDAAVRDDLTAGIDGHDLLLHRDAEAAFGVDDPGHDDLAVDDHVGAHCSKA